MPPSRYPARLVEAFFATVPQTERDLVLELKAALGDDVSARYDDFAFLRFLRARDLSVPKAEKMFRSMLDLRAKYRADTMLENYTPPEVLAKYFPHGMDWGALDSLGGPIYFMAPGPTHVKGITNSASVYDIIKFSIYQSVKIGAGAVRISEERGEMISHVTLVVDCDSLGASHLNGAFISAFTGLVQAFETMWPETIKTIFVLNPPPIFPMAYRIIKPFLNENTRKKIQILTCNQAKNLAAMADLIPPSSLPTRYGGTLESDEIVFASKVPKALQSRSIEGEEVAVPARYAVWVAFICASPDSLIKYSVQTASHNIGFGLYWSPAPVVLDEALQLAPEDEAQLVEVEPAQKYDCHIAPHQAQVRVEREGTYLAKFDNTFSWMRSKAVTYALDVVGPSKEEQTAGGGDAAQGGAAQGDAAAAARGGHHSRTDAL